MVWFQVPETKSASIVNGKGIYWKEALPFQGVTLKRVRLLAIVDPFFSMKSLVSLGCCTRPASCAASLGHLCAYVLLVKARGTVVGRVEETASTRLYSFPGTLGVLTQAVWLSFYLANSQITLPLLTLNASLSTPCLYLWTQTSQR